jgi:cell division GTPase FtsZ
MAIQPENPRALDLCAVGLGQGGGNLAAEWSRRGYRSLLLNTARSDMRGLSRDGGIDIPEKFRVHIGIGTTDGAGKDPEYGAACLREHADLVRASIEENLQGADAVLLCAGLGGGTGSAVPELLRLLEPLDIPIISVVTLPAHAESGITKVNAVRTANALVTAPLHGRVFIDNERLVEAFPEVDVISYYPHVNARVLGPLDALNRLNARADHYSIRSFDGEDMRKVLLSGGVLQTHIERLDASRAPSAADLIAVVERCVNGGLHLASGLTLGQCAYLAMVIVGPEHVLKKTPIQVFDEAIATLKEKTQGGAVYEGLYVGPDDTPLEVYVLSASLALPTRVQELLGAAQIEGQDLMRKIQEEIPELEISPLEGLDLFRAPARRRGAAAAKPVTPRPRPLGEQLMAGGLATVTPPPRPNTAKPAASAVVDTAAKGAPATAVPADLAVSSPPPKVEPPKVEPPKVEPPKVEPPKVEPPKVEPPKVEPPKVEPPKVEPPKVEPPKVEGARVESPTHGPVATSPVKATPAKASIPTSTTVAPSNPTSAPPASVVAPPAKMPAPMSGTQRALIDLKKLSEPQVDDAVASGSSSIDPSFSLSSLEGSAMDIPGLSQVDVEALDALALSEEGHAAHEIPDVQIRTPSPRASPDERTGIFSGATGERAVPRVGTGRYDDDEARKLEPTLQVEKSEAARLMAGVVRPATATNARVGKVSSPSTEGTERARAPSVAADMAFMEPTIDVSIERDEKNGEHTVAVPRDDVTGGPPPARPDEISLPDGRPVASRAIPRVGTGRWDDDAVVQEPTEYRVDMGSMPVTDADQAPVREPAPLVPSRVVKRTGARIIVDESQPSVAATADDAPTPGENGLFNPADLPFEYDIAVEAPHFELSASLTQNVDDDAILASQALRPAVRHDDDDDEPDTLASLRAPTVMSNIDDMLLSSIVGDARGPGTGLQHVYEDLIDRFRQSVDRRGRERVARRLIDDSRADDVELRALAVWAMVKLEEKGFRRALAKSASDENPEIAKLALAGLERIETRGRR